jgi:hypothetical protein
MTLVHGCFKSQLAQAVAALAGQRLTDMVGRKALALDEERPDAALKSVRGSRASGRASANDDHLKRAFRDAPEYTLRLI